MMEVDLDRIEALARATFYSLDPDVIELGNACLALIERVREAEARASAFDEIRAELGMIYEDGTPYPTADVVEHVRELNEMEPKAVIELEEWKQRIAEAEDHEKATATGPCDKDDLSWATRDDHKRAGIISPEDAQEILVRFCNSHFNNPGEHARVSIPARPERDDDIRMSAFIARAAWAFAEVERLREREKAARIGGLREAVAIAANDHDHYAGVDCDPIDFGAFQERIDARIRWLGGEP